MSKRDDLRPMFEKCPRWLLLVSLIFVGIPLAYMERLAEAWWEVTCEIEDAFQELWDIDKE